MAIKKQKHLIDAVNDINKKMLKTFAQINKLEKEHRELMKKIKSQTKRDS